MLNIRKFKFHFQHIHFFVFSFFFYFFTIVKQKSNFEITKRKKELAVYKLFTHFIHPLSFKSVDFVKQMTELTNHQLFTQAENKKKKKKRHSKLKNSFTFIYLLYFFFL